mgnify:CR=1 FL=1
MNIKEINIKIENAAVPYCPPPPAQPDLRVLVLRCKDVRELRKLVVSSGVARRAQALERLSSSSRELKIASGAGSFLTAGLASVQCVASTGIASNKGEVAEWPSGIFRMVFNAQQVNGEAVFMPGDIFTGTGRVLSAPIHLEIENGNLVEILGDSPDANYVRSHLESESDAILSYAHLLVKICLLIVPEKYELFYQLLTQQSIFDQVQKQF